VGAHKHVKISPTSYMQPTATDVTCRMVCLLGLCIGHMGEVQAAEPIEMPLGRGSADTWAQRTTY